MKVQELLFNESKWVQGRGAENACGEEVACSSPHAVKWCILGAVCHCYAEGDTTMREATVRLYAALMELFGHDRIAVWQDDPSTTFEMVQELLIKADV